MPPPIRSHVEVTGSSRQARKELGLLNNEVVRTSRDIRRMAGTLRTLGVLALGSAFVKIVAQEGDWNRVLAQTATLLGLNDEEAAAYGARMDELAKIALDTAGVTKGQLAGALAQSADRIRALGGALAPTERIFTIYNEALRLSIATGQDFVDSLNVMLLMHEAFEIAPERSADAMKLLTSAIIVGGKSFVNLSKWLEDIGPLAADAGFRLEDVLAVLTKFDKDHGVGAVKAAAMLRGMAADGDADAKRLYESMMLAFGIDPSQATLLEVVDALTTNLRETPGFAKALGEAIDGAVSEDALRKLAAYTDGLQALQDRRDDLTVHAGTGLVPETPPGGVPTSDPEVERILRAGQRLNDQGLPSIDEAQARGSHTWKDTFERNLVPARRQVEEGSGGAALFLKTIVTAFRALLPGEPSQEEEQRRINEQTAQILAMGETMSQKIENWWKNLRSPIGNASAATGPLSGVGAFAGADASQPGLVLDQAPRGLEGAQAIIDAAVQGDEAAKQLVQSLGLVEGPTLSAAEVMATLGQRVQDGTADLGALKAVFDQGIIGQDSIAEIVVYATQAQILAEALRAITREGGTAAEALNRIRPPPVASGFIGPLLPGQQRLPEFGSGGIVRATSGGSVVRVAEAGEDEWIVPQSRMEELLAHINAPMTSIRASGRALASSDAAPPSGGGERGGGASGGGGGDGGLHLYGDVVLPSVRHGDQLARELKKEARRREFEANFGQLGSRKGR